MKPGIFVLKEAKKSILGMFHVAHEFSNSFMSPIANMQVD